MSTQMFPWQAFLLFALVNVITPGPNVILLASSGGMWGLKRTIPHLIGICLGFPCMLLLVLYGLEPVFRTFPGIFSALTVVSLLYVLWLSYRIFQMGRSAEIRFSKSTRPMTFVEAVLFQWVNGKAWQIALMTATLYATSSHLVRFSEALTLSVFTLITGLLWIELGKRIAGLLTNPKIRKIYYWTLAIALLLSTWPSGISRLFN